MAAINETSGVHQVHSSPPETANVLSSPTVNTGSLSSPDENTVTSDPIEDPSVAALHSMFPDFDPIILNSVLESVSGDQDKAVDALLGMSDPSYKPTIRPDAVQTELDEEFARHLMLEDQSHQRAPWRPQYDNPTARTQAPDSTNDSVAQIQEQLGKFAESSKRTLGTFFSKVKAKIQELDSPAEERTTPPRRVAASPPQPSYQPYQAAPDPAISAGYESYRSEEPHRVASDDGSSSRAPSVPINRSSIGLLPKRPVTLDSSPQPSSAGPADDDELEYVTNPFEEERK